MGAMGLATRRRATGLCVAAALCAALALGADKTQTAAGTVARVQSTTRTVVVALADGGEATFTWNADTRITGVLTPGVRVTVRYVAGSGDGTGNLALQITVARS